MDIIIHDLILIVVELFDVDYYCDLEIWVRHRRRQGDSRTEFNRILCTSKSEAAVTGNKKTALTTDKHEASRGLSATAELVTSWVQPVAEPVTG